MTLRCFPALFFLLRSLWDKRFTLPGGPPARTGGGPRGAPWRERKRERRSLQSAGPWPRCPPRAHLVHQLGEEHNEGLAVLGHLRLAVFGGHGCGCNNDGGGGRNGRAKASEANAVGSAASADVQRDEKGQREGGRRGYEATGEAELGERCQGGCRPEEREARRSEKLEARPSLPLSPLLARLPVACAAVSSYALGPARPRDDDASYSLIVYRFKSAIDVTRWLCSLRLAFLSSFLK